MRLRPLIVAAAALVATTASLARAPSPGRSPAPTVSSRVVDSVRSVDEELRRFRADIAVAPTKLVGGAATRRDLVRGFIHALATGDTAALVDMALTRAEFAFLTYPSSPYTKPPYRQSPEIVWLLLGVGHDKGLTRLLRRLGGRDLAYLGHRCAPKPLEEGHNRIWRGCAVRLRLGTSDIRESRLFGAIIERDGHFKFATYASDY